AGGDAAGGKRKRRRRKKGKGPRAEGEAMEGGPGPGPDEGRGRRRDAPLAPFSRFFTGANAGRKHGFAVGEVVAGRVKAVEDGTITVDLFGKALAYADEHEPRELPPEPEPPPVVSPKVAAAIAAAEGAHAAADAAAAEAAAAEEGTGESPAAAEASAPAQEPEAAAEPVASVDAAAVTEPGVDLEAAAAVAEADAHEHAEQDHDDDADGDEHDGARSARGPLLPAPVVPENLPRQEPPALGQVFRGRVGAVAESGHIALVNRIIDRKAVLQNAERYRVERRRVQGLVYGFNRGGFDVLVEGLRAFCPASAMALEEIGDPHELVGKRLEFLLPSSQNLSKDLIVSRRSILERQLRKKAKELIKTLQPGQRIKGRVTQVREFGVFVDIGGIEGLVHQSELSFQHGVRPMDVAKPGDEVEVQILRVGADPRRTSEGVRRERIDRVSLSMKSLMPDPWDAHNELLQEGTVRTGKVTRTTEFGAFIELAPQVEGLLHITELGRDLQHASQAVKEGDELPVVIERVDARARRISLSKLTAQEAEEFAKATGEEAPRSLRPGSRITVKVARVEPRGLVVRVAGVVGRRARGYVPSTELLKGAGDLRKAYALGSELDVKIIGLDRDGGLRCSPKALQIDEERRAVKDYRREAAKQGFGTFGDLLRAKLGEGGK
ncbi:MAG TPA: S1 RNA-binding domain-containing protein, partial [Polyangiales bacterium]|nr:S1 RNA-binding domain-containing protein [Polyangiales bacterium]